MRSYVCAYVVARTDLCGCPSRRNAHQNAVASLPPKAGVPTTTERGTRGQLLTALIQAALLALQNHSVAIVVRCGNLPLKVSSWSR
mmetsp:Transcript_35890/g.89314  ORF Transcript_35890/g.89314 Transcript_35890/m.89314 type:complete len:86 (+) Transcript_35890:136-393(+)